MIGSFSHAIDYHFNISKFYILYTTFIVICALILILKRQQIISCPFVIHCIRESRTNRYQAISYRGFSQSRDHLHLLYWIIFRKERRRKKKGIEDMYIYFYFFLKKFDSFKVKGTIVSDAFLRDYFNMSDI